GGAFDTLNKPIDDLSWVQPILHVAASILFVSLVFLGARRRRIVAGLGSVLSCVCIITAVPFGLIALDRYLYKSTPCSARSVEAAQQRTADDQVRMLVEGWLARMRAENGEQTVRLTGVEQQKRSLVLRLQANERARSREGFDQWVQDFRRTLVNDFCRSDH